ncbi:MAG TPA: RNA polymerase sigma factor [Terriglobia bacterium]|nr:RNA polymerase sigma factor [Terriglobia bacterium]
MKGRKFMEYGPDNSDIVQGTLSMVRMPGPAVPPETAEVAQVVRLVLSGDTAAFEHIIVRYERRVINIAMRILGCHDDAHDAAQEVFLRVFRYLHRLDLEKPIEPWLMRMTVNVCRDLGRKRRHHRATSLEHTPSEAMTAHSSGNPSTELEEEQQRQILWKALACLPENERVAIVLRDVEGLSTAEVSTILESPEVTVRSRISRGRLKLKEIVDRMICGPMNGGTL